MSVKITLSLSKLRLPTVWADIGAEKGERGFKPRVDTLQRAMLELKISASRQVESSVLGEFEMISQHVHRGCRSWHGSDTSTEHR